MSGGGLPDERQGGEGDVLLGEQREAVDVLGVVRGFGVGCHAEQGDRDYGAGDVCGV